MKKIVIIGTILVGIISLQVNAKRYWTTVLTDWKFSLNNGVAYITSPQIPSHCNYSRAQINMSGTEFDKSLYAFVLAASQSKKKIRIVIDDTQTSCVASGSDIVD